MRRMGQKVAYGGQIMFYLADRTILASSFQSWKPRYFRHYEKSFSFLFSFVNVSILCKIFTFF